MIFEKYKAVLLRENELVKKAVALQALIWKAVLAREWACFEAHNEAMNALSGEFTLLEQEREEIYSGLSSGGPRRKGQDDSMVKDEKGRFYALAASLPAEQRNELSSLYRNLKLEALKLRVSNEALLSHISESRASIAGFFELAFPERGGRIYTPRGMTVSHDMRSMVLNRRF